MPRGRVRSWHRVKVGCPWRLCKPRFAIRNILRRDEAAGMVLRALTSELKGNQAAAVKLAEREFPGYQWSDPELARSGQAVEQGAIAAKDNEAYRKQID